MKIRKLVLLGLLIALPFSTLVQAQNFSASVNLHVISSDKKIQDEMYSYAARELRSLGDVSIKSAGNEYGLIIMIEEIQKDYYSMTTLFLRTVSFKTNNPAKPFETTSSLEAFDAISLSSTPLKSRAESIVARFDTLILEPKRRTKQPE